MSAVTVKVIDQVTPLDVSIMCPNVTVAAKIVSCVLTSIRGTDLAARFDYNRTAASHYFVDIPSRLS
jgi:hypothetical protein